MESTNRIKLNQNKSKISIQKTSATSCLEKLYILFGNPNDSASVKITGSAVQQGAISSRFDDHQLMGLKIQSRRQARIEQRST